MTTLTAQTAASRPRPAGTAAGSDPSVGQDARPAGDSTHMIEDWRTRIDQIDQALIELWRERAAISQRVGATRVAAGGTRLVLSRESEILDRFAAALGEDGAQLALLLLRAGRGRL